MSVRVVPLGWDWHAILQNGFGCGARRRDATWNRDCCVSKPCHGFDFLFRRFLRTAILVFLACFFTPRFCFRPLINSDSRKPKPCALGGGFTHITSRCLGSLVVSSKYCKYSSVVSSVGWMADTQFFKLRDTPAMLVHYLHCYGNDSSRRKYLVLWAVFVLPLVSQRLHVKRATHVCDMSFFRSTA